MPLEESIRNGCVRHKPNCKKETATATMATMKKKETAATPSEQQDEEFQ